MITAARRRGLQRACGTVGRKQAARRAAPERHRGHADHDTDRDVVELRSPQTEQCQDLNDHEHDDRRQQRDREKHPQARPRLAEARVAVGSVRIPTPEPGAHRKSGAEHRDQAERTQETVEPAAQDDHVAPACEDAT